MKTTATMFNGQATAPMSAAIPVSNFAYPSMFLLLQSGYDASAKHTSIKGSG
jgi:hypothetical protein